MYDRDNIIGFCGVLHQPNKNPKLKRCSRIVILPDYQGIGLGYKFLTEIAEMYARKGFDFSIVTSAKNFIFKLYNSPKWTITHVGVNKCTSPKSRIDQNRASKRNVKTASFRYRK